ncbi:MAG: hypothetical protein EA387_05025 [Nitriliruptor sp.]|nr:MAG: hypothetical protein EA387_05025 [Nitriliruptor sp.]
MAVEAEQRSALALQALADPGRFAPEKLGDLLSRQGGLLELAPPQHARDQRRPCGAVRVDPEVVEHGAFVLGETAATGPRQTAQCLLDVLDRQPALVR